MAVRKTKDESVRLTDERIAMAIQMLEPSNGNVKPSSKKDVCDFLGIAYNTTRLTSIIEEYKSKIETEKAKRAEKRGKPATQEEITFCVTSYLVDNMAINNIAKALYRSVRFVTIVLEQEGVTFRPILHDYFNPTVISEADTRERFEIGEIVYNARYNTNCLIKSEQVHPKHGYVYGVWLLGDFQQFAYTAAYDLGSLSVLKRVNGK